MARRPLQSAPPRMKAAVVAAAVLVLTGCVQQAVPEGVVLEQHDELGVTPEPLHEGEAQRVAVDDRTSEEQTRERVPEREPEGGLVIRGTKADGSDDQTSPVAGDTEASSPRQEDESTRPRPSGDSSAGGTDPGSGSGDGSDGNGGGGAGGGSGDGSGRAERAGDDPPRDDPPPSPQPQPQPEPQPEPGPTFRTLADVSDRSGDQGREGPAYADARRLLVESDGQRARVSVAMNAALPDTLEKGEVEGIGIDFFRGDSQESQYQLFADGGSDGWRAFLQTPDGFVEYPGEFRLGGRVLVFEVPWSSLGGRRSARVGSFVDWSQERSPLNAVGNDRLPDDGMVTIEP